jgi:adenine-specific DNA-methyltransferase
MSLEMNKLLQVNGVGPGAVRALVAAGYTTLAQVAAATPDQLTAVKGIGQATAAAILALLGGAGETTDAVQTYRYDETRKNIPPAGLAAQGRIEERPKVRYSYDPHLPPVLRFDGTGKADALPELLQIAQQRALTADEPALLAAALRTQQPWLEWAGKREQRWFEVDPVALHLHERVSAEAIIATARRQDVQRSLFADPEFEYREQVKFYQYDMEWANRLILGDSLVAMNSLAKREDLAGKVQMIYIDPPYGIKFASNFQPFVGQREVKDREQDLTREPEQVKAYRDTWTLGIHSYLAYLRDRLIAAKELLSETGSICVQIGDENLHRVRDVLDEVFGAEHCISVISFTTTTGFSSNYISNIADHVLWYAKDIARAYFQPIFKDKVAGDEGAAKYRPLSMDRHDLALAYDETVLASFDQITAQGATGTEQTFVMNGSTYMPPTGMHWKTSVR